MASSMRMQVQIMLSIKEKGSGRIIFECSSLDQLKFVVSACQLMTLFQFYSSVCLDLYRLLSFLFHI